MNPAPVVEEADHVLPIVELADHAGLIETGHEGTAGAVLEFDRATAPA